MAFTEASICNIALARIGVTHRIDSLDDATTEAQACKSIYQHVLETLLAAAPWPFATTRASLALISDDSADSSQVGGWGYTYALPAACITVLRVWGGDRIPIRTHKPPFLIEYDATSGRVLRTDMESTDDAPMQVEYVKYADNPALFPPNFRDALAWSLASDLAMALSVDDGRSNRARQMAELTTSRAAATALNEQHEINPDSELIAERAQLEAVQWR